MLPYHYGLYPLELLAKTNSPFLELPLVMVFYCRDQLIERVAMASEIKFLETLAPMINISVCFML